MTDMRQEVESRIEKLQMKLKDFETEEYVFLPLATGGELRLNEAAVLMWIEQMKQSLESYQ